MKEIQHFKNRVSVRWCLAFGGSHKTFLMIIVQVYSRVVGKVSQERLLWQESGIL